MGLLSTLLTLPVSGPIKGVVWVAGRVAEVAEEQVSDAGVQRELAELERARMFDELSEDEYRQREEALWQRLQANRTAQEDPDGD